MQSAATAWNFAPADDNRLADLLKLFGCSDEIASVDVDAFGRRVGELIRRGGVTATASCEEKPALRTSSVELRSISERTSLLNALHNAPRSDRLTMIAAAAGSMSLLIAAGAALSEL